MGKAKPGFRVSILLILTIALSFSQPASASENRDSVKKEIHWGQAMLDTISLGTDALEVLSGVAILSTPVLGQIAGGALILDGGTNAVYHAYRLKKNLWDKTLDLSSPTTTEGLLAKWIAKKAGAGQIEQESAGMAGDFSRTIGLFAYNGYLFMRFPNYMPVRFEGSMMTSGLAAVTSTINTVKNLVTPSSPDSSHRTIASRAY